MRYRTTRTDYRGPRARKTALAECLAYMDSDGPERYPPGTVLWAELSERESNTAIQAAIDLVTTTSKARTAKITVAGPPPLSALASFTSDEPYPPLADLSYRTATIGIHHLAHRIGGRIIDYALAVFEDGTVIAARSIGRSSVPTRSIGRSSVPTREHRTPPRWV